MTDFLDRVVAERRADAASAARAVPEDELRRRGATVAAGTRDAFTGALAARRDEGRLGVIAEVKKVSPALGALRPDADARAIARRYEQAGAAAISVLCEPRHWGGSLADLSAVREVVSVPVLCKDVIVTEYQVAEAYAAGAHAVLLIAEALDDALLRRLVERAGDLGLGVLLEAHETRAFERAVGAGMPVVGVNARDLRAPTDLRPDRIERLHGLARPGQILVAESGIGGVEDARRLPSRVDAVLVGTALMTSDDPSTLVRGLASIPRARGVEAAAASARRTT